MRDELRTFPNRWDQQREANRVQQETMGISHFGERRKGELQRNICKFMMHTIFLYIFKLSLNLHDLFIFVFESRNMWLGDILHKRITRRVRKKVPQNCMNASRDGVSLKTMPKTKVCNNDRVYNE